MELQKNFMGKFRKKCLRGCEDENLKGVKVAIAEWFRFYNEKRPHLALAYRTPSEFCSKLGLSYGI